MRPVVLVSLDWLRPHDPRRSLGAASLAAALTHAGAEVTLIEHAVNAQDFDVRAVCADIRAALRDAGPTAWLGVGAFVWNEPEVQAILATFAVDHDVMLGGPQVSFAPNGDLERLYPGAAAFVRGHGEFGIVALAAGTARSGQHGVHLAGTPDLHHRADTPLDNLASPYLTGVLQPTASSRWETARGCMFRCSFCQHREPGDQLRHRELGGDRLRRELLLLAKPHVQRVSVLDPIFHQQEDRAIALLRAARDVGLTAQLSLQCRAELLTPAFLDATEGLDVHLELGLQTAIEREATAVGRPNRMEKVDAALASLRERHISHEISLIYGLPGQTLDSFRRSVAWCAEREVPIVRAWPLMLLRGTPLADHRAKWGMVEASPDGRIPIVVQSHTMSRDDHAEMTRIAAALPYTSLWSPA